MVCSCGSWKMLANKVSTVTARAASCGHFDGTDNRSHAFLKVRCWPTPVSSQAYRRIAMDPFAVDAARSLGARIAH